MIHPARIQPAAAAHRVRWQRTLDRLDALSRQRALSDAESALLEHAIRQVDHAASVTPDRAQKRWSRSEDSELVALIGNGCTVSEAGRRIGRGRCAAIARWNRLQRRTAA